MIQYNYDIYSDNFALLKIVCKSILFLFTVSSTVDNVIWMMETYTYNAESPIHKSSTGRFSAVYKGTFGESSVAIKVLNGVPACGIGRKYVICYYMIRYELILLEIKLSTKQLCDAYKKCRH